MRALVAGALAFVLALGAAIAFLPRPDAPPDEAPDGDEVRTLAVDAEETRLRGLDAPEWRVGDSWRVRFPLSDFACTLVVVEANASGYRQGAACEGAQFLAAEDAVFDYAFLGRFGAGLQGHPDGEQVVFYDWPLKDGKRWTTRWSDEDVEVRATLDPNVEGPDGPEPGFRLEMVDGDGDTRIQYDYVPSLQWWSQLRFPASGFRMEVRSFEEGWEGEAVHAEAEARLALGGLGLTNGAFSVSSSDDMLLVVHQASQPALHRAQIQSPSGSVEYEANVVPVGSFRGFRMAYLEPEPGTWRADLVHVGGGDAALAIHVINLFPIEL